jgi:hypothetical protein
MKDSCMKEQGTNNRAMTNCDRGKKNGERGTNREWEQHLLENSKSYLKAETLTVAYLIG